MIEEMLTLLNDLKEPITKFLENANKTSFLDYLPHLISAVAVIASMVIVIIQHRKGIELHQKAELYNTKKETILEALSFLDTYISWQDVDSGIIPSREEINDIRLAVQARTIHNKLCISCDDSRIVDLFVDLVVPDKGPTESYPVFKKFNEFRNACRKELGYKAIDLPIDKIFLARVSTGALDNEQKSK